MISKKLINQVPEAKVHIKRSVLFQLISLIANIFIMILLGIVLEEVYGSVVSYNQANSLTVVKNFGILNHPTNLFLCIAFLLGAIGLRFVCVLITTKESYKASKSVKLVLREKIYKKMLKVGSGYTKKLSTSEVLQVTGEGVDQLEVYFGSYLPQFFYAMTAPIILFIVVSFFSIKTAILLFLCVPLIPISIIAVQKFAKKLLAKYWGEYTGLGDDFLENLQGLNTLKIYGADEMKHKQMNIQAERFRKITMRVLTMQLNSISVMDIIAYGGTAVGIMMALLELQKGNLSIAGTLTIILLCSDFFLPMRLLGSYFHVAMNGMAASKKIFALLELEEEIAGTKEITNHEINVTNLSYSYEDTKAIDKLTFETENKGVYALVGESGCGKSTIAGILSGNLRSYEGEISIGKTPLNQVAHEEVLNHLTLIGLGSYLFKGTVEENLRMAKKSASENELWEALELVNLDSFMKSQKGLQTLLTEGGKNLSGGQCQRLAMARALLHDTPIYIFDESTSNIDIESENDIMNAMKKLGEQKLVLLISHRLANVVDCKKIFVISKGKVVEEGIHNQLLANKKEYTKLWNTQWNLEHLIEEEEVEELTKKGGEAVEK